MDHNIVPAPGGRPWKACRRCLKVMTERNRTKPCPGLVRLRSLKVKRPSPEHGEQSTAEAK